MSELRNEIIDAVGLNFDDFPKDINFSIVKSEKESGYTRQLIEYNSFGDIVSAYLLIPDVVDKNPAVLINHQHNSEWHI